MELIDTKVQKTIILEDDEIKDLMKILKAYKGNLPVANLLWDLLDD